MPPILPIKSLCVSGHYSFGSLIGSALLFAGCNWRAISKTENERGPTSPAKQLPNSVPAWLAIAERNFYGTGPWIDAPLEVVWGVETGLISGKLHKDPWGGTSWPGQPSVDDERVYFRSADGYLYCLEPQDGSLSGSSKRRTV